MGRHDPDDDTVTDAGDATRDMPGSPADDGRRLFQYIVGEEWLEHRAVMGVFAGTFFSEFTPDEVTERLAAAGFVMDPTIVAARLESLRRWGNLSASSSVGNPTSLADYYRRRSRYLITSVGQEVHTAVETVLAHIDEVRDVSTGRLRTLRDALAALAEIDPARTDPAVLADLVRAVFDPHQTFTTEITQFFAAINQWQSRYDLTAEEFTFFAEVLVGYVAERLDEIERSSRPIGRLLEAVRPHVPTIVERAARGLASRVEEKGLQGTVAVTKTAGSTNADWEHLFGWFVGRTGRRSRLERLHEEALSAIRTLTLNLTRLSRVGVGASSRRADFLRLATFLEGADDPAPVAAAALGLYPAGHYGVLAADADDPQSTATSWWDAPRAPVPVSIRERGDTTNRGRTSPIADRSVAQRAVRLQREREADALRRVDAELLQLAGIDGATISAAAFGRLQQLIGLALQQLPVRASRHDRTDGTLRCTVERTPGRNTVVTSPDGSLRLLDLRILVEAADG